MNSEVKGFFIIVSALLVLVLGLIYLVNNSGPKQAEGSHAPQHLDEYGLVRYENHEVICYRASGYEGLACKWKEMPAGSYCKLPEAK